MAKNLSLEVALEMNGEDRLPTREIILEGKFLVPGLYRYRDSYLSFVKGERTGAPTFYGASLLDLQRERDCYYSQVYLEVDKILDEIRPGWWTEEDFPHWELTKVYLKSGRCAYALMWAMRAGFVPRSRAILEDRYFLNLVTLFGTKSWRWFDQAAKENPSILEYGNDHERYGAFLVSVHFRDRWKEWMSRYQSFNRASIAIYDLKDLDDSWRSWALRHPREEVEKVLVKLETVKRFGGHPGTPLEKLLVMASSRFFGSSPIAVEAGRWLDYEADFLEISTRWEAASREANIPPVEASNGKYTLRMLPKDDPRGLFLGYHTNCCQHPRGAGASCAWHGVENPDGGFLALFDDRNNIVAQSWVWIDQTGNRLCLDNIEVKGGHGRLAGVLDLYLEVCRQWGDHGFTQVNLGMGYVEDIKTFESFSYAYTAEFMTPPAGVYTDAKSQRILWKKEGQ